LIPQWLAGRIVAAVVLAGIAGLHLYLPKIPIDAISIGLVASAAALIFFDVDTLEWRA
jgi:hypothetical protein